MSSPHCYDLMAPQGEARNPFDDESSTTSNINIDDLSFNYFLEEEEDHLCANQGIDNEIVQEEDDDDETGVDDGDENNYNKAFWESQEHLLKKTLFRTTRVETKIREATKEALKELRRVGVYCVCRNMILPAVDDGCNKCFQKGVCARLRDAGFDCLICISKWRSSPGIPSGEHSYMQVVHKSEVTMRVIIELKFREEFEMARGSEEYRRLIASVPQVYVGKSERLGALVKILCAASKKLMKERKMHIAPWRKHEYMKAKWLTASPIIRKQQQQQEACGHKGLHAHL